MKKKFILELDESVADDIFEIFQELISRAKENHDDTVLSYSAPIFIAFGKALIQAKKKVGKPCRYTLPKFKNDRSFN